MSTKSDIDYDFITAGLAVGNVASRAVSGFVAVVTILATDRPGILADELYGAPTVPNGGTVDDWCDGACLVPVLYVDLADGESKSFGTNMHELDDRLLTSITAFIAAHIARGPVLVHCGAGISRSAAVVVAYFCRYAGMSYTEALAFVRSRRPMSTFDNVFVSKPLTAANLQRAIDDMTASCSIPIAIAPDALIMPLSLVESSLNSARRLSRRLARPVQTGRYEQRRRRRVEGVWESQLRRRAAVERELTDTLLFVEMLEDWHVT